MTNNSVISLLGSGAKPDTVASFYFAPTAGFIGDGGFKVATSSSTDGLGATVYSTAVASTVRVASAKAPFLAAANPGFLPFVGPRAKDLATYDFSVYYNDDVSVNGGKLGDGDVVVRSLDGKYTASAKFLGQASDSKETIATYRIVPPGGTWDVADNTVYVASLAAGRLFDNDGNAAPAQDFALFSADLTPPGSGIPNAALTAAPIGNADDGKAVSTIALQLADDTGIKTATVIGKDDYVTIVGPNGFITSAKYTSINDAADGQARTVTYTFVPPGGTWDKTDNGTYTVYLRDRHRCRQQPRQRRFRRGVHCKHRRCRR